MKVAIHQPNFIPWMGYFDKIVKNDVFIVLDHLIVNVKNPDWMKKVFYANRENRVPMSLPIVRGEKGSFQKINDIEVDQNNSLWQKNYKSLKQTYCKHPYYEEVLPLVDQYFSGAESSLFKLNMQFIEGVLHRMDLTPFILLSSTLNSKRKSNELLIDLVKDVGGTSYVSGGGAEGYQKPELFEDEGIKLEFQDFKQEPYSQYGSKEFLPGLTILDSLFNLGFAQTRTLLQ